MRTLVVKLGRRRYWGMWPSDVPSVDFNVGSRPCPADCPTAANGIGHRHWFAANVLERRSRGWRPVARLADIGPGNFTTFTRE